MLERKNNKEKKSLEDMIAYLDENGNLTSTPPDPKKKKNFPPGRNADQCVPKQEDRPANERRIRRGKFSLTTTKGLALSTIVSLEKEFLYM